MRAGAQVQVGRRLGKAVLRVPRPASNEALAIAQLFVLDRQSSVDALSLDMLQGRKAAACVLANAYRSNFARHTRVESGHLARCIHFARRIPTARLCYPDGYASLAKTLEFLENQRRFGRPGPEPRPRTERCSTLRASEEHDANLTE